MGLSDAWLGWWVGGLGTGPGGGIEQGREGVRKKGRGLVKHVQGRKNMDRRSKKTGLGGSKKKVLGGLKQVTEDQAMGGGGQINRTGVEKKGGGQNKGLGLGVKIQGGPRRAADGAYIGESPQWLPEARARQVTKRRGLSPAVPLSGLQG